MADRWSDHAEAGIGEAREFPYVSLVELAASGVPPPELQCGDTLYAGALHSLSGPPDSGKSTLAYWWMLMLLRAERRVILLDEESGREATTEKLLALGAEKSDFIELDYVEFPGRRWDEADWLGLNEMVSERPCSLVVYDSAAALLATAGLDENSNSDVTTFYKRLLAVARHHKVASLLLDHVTKNGQGGRYSRGGGAKLATVDVNYLLEPVKAFNRHQSGILTLTATKDRRGYLHREHEVRVEVEDGAMALGFTRTEKPAGDDLPPAARKLLDVLGAQDDAQPIKALIDRLADRYGHGLKRPTASSALNLLADRGLADSLAPTGGEKSWWRTQ